MKTLIPFLSLGLLLSGCASDAYYSAVAEQQKAKYNRPAPPPLVHHTWVDSGGKQQTLTVNQPACAVQEKTDVIPAPGQVAFQFYDRTLSTVERNLPWFMFFSGGRSNGGTTYQAGGDITTIETTGDSSDVDIQRDIGYAAPEEEGEAEETEEEVVEEED